MSLFQQDPKFRITKGEKYVERVDRYLCKDFILNIHYAHRWPSISHSYGLFFQDRLIGVVCYGIPSSAPLRSGLAGVKFQSSILELNRLCLRDNLKNDASFLIGSSIKLLPINRIIISYADPSVGHVGYVYQATNFIYCGLSEKRTDWKIKGKEHLHGQTIADEFRGVSNRADAMRDKYGDDFYLLPRPQKHRYIYFSGTKTFRREAKSALKYHQQPYPKVDKKYPIDKGTGID